MISGVQQSKSFVLRPAGGRDLHKQYAIHWTTRSEALPFLTPRLVSRYSVNKDRELMLILYVQMLFRHGCRPIHDTLSLTPTPQACRYKAGLAEKDIDRQSKPCVYHD